jgi:hypothetical protein
VHRIVPLPYARAVAIMLFFREIGVALHEEEHGKLFPDANRSSVVLQALLDEASRRGVSLRAGERVEAVEPRGDGFLVRTARETLEARRVVLATGGLSLPKTGSDGAGLRLAEALGHSLVPTTPALVPLRLAGRFHEPLSGVAHEVELTVRAGGRVLERRTARWSWTCREYGSARASRGRSPTLEASLLPGRDFVWAERELLRAGADRPRHRRSCAKGRIAAARGPVGNQDSTRTQPSGSVEADLARVLPVT